MGVIRIIANQKDYQEDELEDERRVLDVNVDGRTKFVDLDKQKRVKGKLPTSGDEFDQSDNDIEEDGRDIKEDEQDMTDDEFEDKDEEEVRRIDDPNKYNLADTKQKKQGT